MFKSRMSIIVGWLGLVLLVALSGCTNKIQGTKATNKVPIIYFSNIPVDSSTFSFNQEISWYATDIDGYVTSYQYTVVIGDSLHVIGKLWGGTGNISSVDSACSVLVRIPPSQWVDYLTDLDTAISFISAVDTTAFKVKVQLFADTSQTDTVPQYLFVRAVDNDSASSNMIRRMFNRNNHKPKAHITYTPFRYYGATNNITGVKAIYSLPETTVTWKSIKLSWEGSDSLDYRSTQPDFIYRWELWGPFADSFAVINNKAKYDELVSDSTHRLVASSFNEANSSPLITDKSQVIPFDGKFLVNYPHTVPNYSYPDLGYGWYLFIVWTRDDAFVYSDPFENSPSYSNPQGHLWFKIIHPQFTYQPVKKILVLNLSTYDCYSYAGSEIYPESTAAFYTRACNSVVKEDLCDSFTYKRYVEIDISAEGLKNVLSRYNLLICLAESNAIPLMGVAQPGNYFPPSFENYLKVGGKMWMIGGNLETFAGFFEAKKKGTLVYLPSNSFSSVYFGLLGLFYLPPAGELFFPDNSHAIEFIGAKPYGHNPSNLPVLETDSAKITNQLNWSEEIYGNDASWLPYSRRLPYASFTYFGTAAKMYTFVAADFITSIFNDKPCGTVYEGPLGPDGRNPIYRTAHLSFGLSFIKEDGAVPGDGAKRDSLFKAMVNWFWEGD